VKFSVQVSIHYFIHSFFILLKSRECSPLGLNEGVNIPPRGKISPLGARGEVKNGPLTTGGRAGAGLGLSPQCKLGLGLILNKPKA
jgi:hypothetical protein